MHAPQLAKYAWPAAQKGRASYAHGLPLTAKVHRTICLSLAMPAECHGSKINIASYALQQRGTSQGVPKNRSIVRLGVAAGKAKENGADGEQTHHERIVEMGDDAHC